MRANTRHDNEAEPLPLRALDWLSSNLNGGLRPGAAYVIAGEPASHKTTLSIQVGLDVAGQGRHVVMLLNEQAPREVQRLAKRVTGARGEMGRIEFRRFNGPADILRVVTGGATERPELVIVDSLQGGGLASTATATYREFYSVLDDAKRRGVITLTLVQTTKTGKMAGPRSLEHKIDVSLFLRKSAGLRQLFIPKNRFGPEIVDPVMLAATKRGLVPCPHALATTASALGVAGTDIIEVQVAVSLPRYGCKSRVNAPSFPSRRMRLVFAIINQLPGVDLNDLSYSINAFVPDVPGYDPAADLPLAVGTLAAYLQQPLSTRSVFVGGLDLRRNIRPPTGPSIDALAHLFAYSHIERVFISTAAAGLLLEDISQYAGTTGGPEVIGVRTLDELVQRLWPSVFTGEAMAAHAHERG